MPQVSFSVVFTVLMTLLALVNGIGNLPRSLRAVRRELGRIPKIFTLATSAILIVVAVYFLRSQLVINGRANVGILATYHYSATWYGETVQLTPLSSGLPREVIFFGTVSSFHTDDANFTCLEGLQLNVYATLPISDKYFVEDHCPSGVTGVWTIPIPPLLTYTVMWHNQPVRMTRVSSPPSPVLSPLPVGQVTLVQTTGRQFTCFLDRSLNVYALNASEVGPQFYVIDICSDGTVGRWTFSAPTS